MKIDSDDMITQAEAARMRGVSHETIRYLVKRGRFKVFTIGGKTFLSRIEVKAFEPDKGGRPKGKQSAKKTRSRTSK